MGEKTDIYDIREVVKKYHPLVFRTAMGFVHVKEDAEDISQEVFIKVYQRLDTFRGESEMSTWLYRITVNVSLDSIAQQQRRSLFEVGEEWLKSLFGRKDNRLDPLAELEEKEEKEIIRRAIDSLPEKQRIAFVLTRYDDLPQKEVASIMGISQRAVEQLLLRAKSNLNKKLAETIRNNR